MTQADEVITKKCRLCDGTLVRDTKRKCLYCPNPLCFGLGEEKKGKDAPSQKKPNRYLDVKPNLERVVEIFEQMFENREGRIREIVAEELEEWKRKQKL